MPAVSGVNNDNEIFCFDADATKRRDEQPEANTYI